MAFQVRVPQEHQVPANKPTRRTLRWLLVAWRLCACSGRAHAASLVCVCCACGDYTRLCRPTMWQIEWASHAHVTPCCCCCNASHASRLLLLLLLVLVLLS